MKIREKCEDKWGVKMREGHEDEGGAMGMKMR